MSTLRRFRTWSRRGATLPEVVVVAASFSVLLAGLVTMGVNSAREWSYGSSRLMADSDASMAVQRIAQEIRDGISGAVSQDKSTLTVQMPYKDTSTGYYDRYRTGDTITYYRDDSGKLFKQVGQNAPLLLGRGLETLTFDGGGDVVAIRLVAKAQTGTKAMKTEYSTQVMFRNQP